MIPPALFAHPRKAHSAVVSKTFPIRLTSITTTTKTSRKARTGSHFDATCTVPSSQTDVVADNFRAAKRPSSSARNEKMAITSPFRIPLKTASASTRNVTISINLLWIYIHPTGVTGRVEGISRAMLLPGR